MDPVIFLTAKLHVRPLHALCQCQWALGISKECSCHCTTWYVSSDIWKGFVFPTPARHCYYFSFILITSAGIKIRRDLRLPFLNECKSYGQGRGDLTVCGCFQAHTPRVKVQR